MYALVALLALGLRLWRLDVFPLSSLEAGDALVALDLSRGGLPGGGNYSPLMVSLGSFFFFLFDATEVTARLGPALLGTGLVLLPLGLRRQLGRVGALAAAILLAFSPLALYLSRTANGEIGVAAGGLAIVVGVLNWFEGAGQAAGSGDPNSSPAPLLPRTVAPLLAGLGLAIALTSGSLVYSLLIALGLAAGLTYLRARPGSRTRSVQDLWGAELQRAVIWGLAGFVVLSTSALFNLDGIAATSDLFSTWLSGFGRLEGQIGGYPAILLLLFYEPLLVVSSLIGLSLVILRRHRFGIFLITWLVASLILDLAMAGRPQDAALLPVLPLALLGGLALDYLGRRLRAEGGWGREGLILGVGLVMNAFAYIELTLWTRCVADTPNCSQAWLIPAVVEVAFLVLVLLFVVGYGFGVGLRGLSLTVLTLALLASLASAWRLNYGPLRLLPYQPLVIRAPATGLLTLESVLADLSAERVGDPTLLDVKVIGLDSPLVRWRLRDFSHLNPVAAAEAGTASPAEGNNAIAILAAPDIPFEALGIEGPYAGQDFMIEASWRPAGLGPKLFIRWLLFREAPTMPAGERVVLWVRQ
ncbi:MAG: hypothetical protein ACE5H9_06590 [Anaerolineae bacterium]